MARFRGTVRGRRGQASRLGYQNLDVSANGWDVGADVELSRVDDTHDQLNIYITGGSNRSRSPRRIAKVTQVDNGGASALLFVLLDPVMGEVIKEVVIG